MEIKNRLFILALDGTPFSLLNQLMSEGIMPNFRQLVHKGDFRELYSVQPPLSSVAWASFMTGAKPAEHGISGFVERDPQTMDWFVPKADRLKKKPLLQILSEKGKRVFSMNVPLTYPPYKVNGILISGFLNKDIRKGTYPAPIGAFLKAKGYVIDADVETGKRDLQAFFEQLEFVLEKRVEMMFHFYQQEKWDFFMTHIMETDRLHHFFWKYFSEDLPPFAEKFRQFYRRIDEIIGKVQRMLPDDTALLLLSDHGFTRLKYEVYLNRWLVENGYLLYEQMPPKSPKDIHPFSKAFSLYPGRIYINLKGREKNGNVNAGPEYERLCEELTNKLKTLRAPDGQPVIAQVHRGFELYGIPAQAGSALFIDPLRLGIVPDLLAIPNKGYDLKGVLWHDRLFDQTVFTGTHTFDDAFLFYQGIEISPKAKSIDTLTREILKFFGGM